MLKNNLIKSNIYSWVRKIPWRRDRVPTSVFEGFAGGSAIKLPGIPEIWVPSLGWEDPLEEGMATHSSILAWRFPKARGACWAHISWGCKELDTTLWLSTFCIKTFSKLEIENFFNLIKVLNCISSITFYGRTLIVLLLKSQSTKRCPLSLYWISVHEVILENDWEVIQFGKEE